MLLAPGEPVPAGAVAVLLDRDGALPAVDPASYDALVTSRANAPAPWVSLAPERLEAQLATIRKTAAQAPVATAMFARLLRLGEGLEFDTALELESLAYSALLGGGEFARWLAGAKRATSGAQALPPVRYGREGNAVTLTLASPGNRNAMTAAMRDALWEALANVLEDPSLPALTLRAEGRCFSTGGDLAEFGSARDLAAAHVIRTRRSSAQLLHRLEGRAEARLHGACIGSGIEIPAAAARRIAAPDLVVQLPELRMGLIPGAGGTVTLARAVGRHRLLWLTLGAFRIGAEQALDWGLIHAIEP
jgi:enoyl-CoA hydratase/carnithine racemase